MNKKEIQSHVDAVERSGRTAEDGNDNDLMVFCANPRNVDSPWQRKATIFVERYIKKGEMFTSEEADAVLGRAFTPNYCGRHRQTIRKGELVEVFEVEQSCWVVEYRDAKSDTGKFFERREREGSISGKWLVKSRDIVGSFADFESRVAQHNAEQDEQAAYRQRYKPVYERFVDLLSQADDIVDRDTLERVVYHPSHGLRVDIAIGSDSDLSERLLCALCGDLFGFQKFPVSVRAHHRLQAPSTTKELVSKMDWLAWGPSTEELGRPETSDRLYRYHLAGFRGSVQVTDEAAIEGMVDRLERFMVTNGVPA
jgi:hypothetical protein